MNKVIIIGGGAATFGGNLCSPEGSRRNYPGANGTGWQEAHDYGERALHITNHCTMDEMIAHIPGNGKFLFGAFLTKLTNEDMIALLESHGLKTSGRGGRVFKAIKLPDVSGLWKESFMDFGGRFFTAESRS